MQLYEATVHFRPTLGGRSLPESGFMPHFESLTPAPGLVELYRKVENPPPGSDGYLLKMVIPWDRVEFIEWH